MKLDSIREDEPKAWLCLKHLTKQLLSISSPIKQRGDCSPTLLEGTERGKLGRKKEMDKKRWATSALKEREV